MAKFSLGKDPFLKKEEPAEEGKPLFDEEEVAQIRATQKVGRPKNDDADDWTRATFIIRKDLLEKLHDYSYTERVDLKTAINTAIEELVKDRNDLLEHPRKPKQIRRKRGGNDG